MNVFGKLGRWYRKARSATVSSRYEKVLKLIPESAFGLSGQTTTRQELQQMIRHTEYEALTPALAYSAWLVEQNGVHLSDEFWSVLGALAQELNLQDSLEDYWPNRLQLPWVPTVEPGRGSFQYELEPYAALKEKGLGAVEVACAARRAGMSEVYGVRLLRDLFGLGLQEAVSIYRQAVPPLPREPAS